MRPLHVFVSLMVVVNVVLAQPALTEPPEFPQVQPGPQALYEGEGCFLLAEGVIFPGDVDWMRIRLPRASTRTVVDVDFPSGTGGSALLAMIVNGASGFNIGDNNNTRDLLCGLHGASTPVGNLRDSVVDLRETSINATIDIAVTGAADTSFVGFHNESFAYEVWVYAIPIPCVDDLSCHDGVACTLDLCDVDSGDCSHTPLDDACDDDFYCNGVEWCDRDFGCRTAPPSCDDGVDCTDDYCDFGVDDCVNEPWDEYCANDLFCDGDEVCDPVAGCRPGVPVDCDDGQDCTVDTCDEEDWRCIHTTADDACDDGQFCNGMEICDFDAGCMNGPVPCPDSLCRESDDRCVDCMSDDDCSDGVYCNGAERCNTLGQCVSGAYPCGTSLCRESDDACVECVADQDCDDGEFCNGVAFCGEDGSCEMGAGPCGDALCRESDDHCVECLSDDHCEDGEFCNGREVCNSDGICVEGLNPCGDSMCHEPDDRCVQCLADADCDDGGFCNGVEQCDDLGACVAGLPPCGDDFFCVEGEDRCAECMTDGDCSDGLFCNGAERCLDSGTCGAGDSPCPAGQACDEAAEQCLQHAFTMDIKPGVCPVRVMTSAQGNLPVAIVGVDVRQIDANSVRLMRVDGVGKPVKAMTGSGQGPRFRDESGPAQSCACPGGEPDGMEDLVVSFKLKEVVKELRLDSLRSGAVVELQITGNLRDGTSMSASDCVTIHAPGRNGISSAQ